MTGNELRAAREAAQVQAADVARLMGVTKQRIRNIENSISISGATKSRYDAALAAAKSEAGRQEGASPA